MAIIFLSAIILSIARLKKNPSEKIRLIVSAGRNQYIYPLDKDGAYKISGPLGTSEIRVENGEAFFYDSPCPNKTCVQSKPVFVNGDWSACLPNEVFIRIEAVGNQTVDAVTF